jgi:hypothetical protein
VLHGVLHPAMGILQSSPPQIDRPSRIAGTGLRLWKTATKNLIQEELQP